MVVFAIGIEDPLMMATDRLQHSHLREDHRPAVLGRPRHQMSGRLHFLHFMFRLRNLFRQPRHGLGEGLQLSAVRQFDRLVKTTGPGHNATPQLKTKTCPQWSWKSATRTWNQKKFWESIPHLR